MEFSQEKYNNESLDEIKEELKKYAAGDAVYKWEDALRKCDGVIVHSILSSFGLSMFEDRIGGSVTTLHNFSAGVPMSYEMNDPDRLRYMDYAKTYDSKNDRLDYNAMQTKIRREIIKDQSSPIVSGYTGKELPRDGRAQLEHIVSVEEIESTAANFLYLDKEKRVNLAYDKSNLTMIESDINQSKGGIPLREWLKLVPKSRKGGESNSEYYHIIENAEKLDEAARKKMLQTQIKEAAKKDIPELGKAGLVTGVTLGMREVVGLILLEFYDEAIDLVTKLMKSYKESYLTFAEVIERTKEGLVNIANRLISDIDKLVKGFIRGFESGFVSVIVTYIINCFITTEANIVRLIRELTSAFIAIGKVMISDQFETNSEKMDEIVDIIMNSISITITAMLSAVLLVFFETYGRVIPETLREALSNSISAIIVGLASVAILYYFESIQSEMVAMKASVAQNALSLTEISIQQGSLEAKSKKRIDIYERMIDELGDL